MTPSTALREYLAMLKGVCLFLALRKGEGLDHGRVRCTGTRERRTVALQRATAASCEYLASSFRRRWQNPGCGASDALTLKGGEEPKKGAATPRILSRMQMELNRSIAI
jgi:hypothetical protein